MNWKDLLIAPSAQLATACNKLDAAGSNFLLVTDAALRPVGLITERGIRMALLKGINLDQPVAAYVEPITAALGNVRLLQTPDAQYTNIIVNENGEIVGISDYADPSIFADDTMVVLMVGGASTRLYPLTADCPKPLLPVQGRPLLENTVEQLCTMGFRKLCMTVGYKAEMICNYFGDGSNWNVEITYVHERERLGTCGALKLLPSRPGTPFIVMNGDLITDVKFNKLLSFHNAAGGKATVCAHLYEKSMPYGVLEFQDDQLRSIREKPLTKNWINAGIYVLDPSLIDLIPPAGAFDMPSLLDAARIAGEQVFVYALHERWIDIGSIEEYNRANSTPGILSSQTQDHEPVNYAQALLTASYGGIGNR